MYLAVIGTTHRAGTTLMQRICNAKENTIIWGEHGGILNKFTKMLKSYKSQLRCGDSEREVFLNSKDPVNEWIANMSPKIEIFEEALISSVITLFEKLYGSSKYKYVGFKEVVYFIDEIELLRKCYPNLKIIFITREPHITWLSYKNFINQFDVKSFAEKWNKNTIDFLDFVYRDKGENIFVKFEDLKNRNDHILNMLKNFIEIDYNKMIRILDKKVGSSKINFKETVDEYKIIEDICGKTRKQLSYN